MFRIALLVLPLALGHPAHAHGIHMTPGFHQVQRVSLNTATSRELRTLPGVGELLAQRIIAARPFRHIEDLSKIKGIRPTHYQQLRLLVSR